MIVKRILRKYGYPPDKQEKGTKTVLEQAEVMEYERQIDQLVYDLYGLTDEEIIIVEGCEKE